MRILFVSALLLASCSSMPASQDASAPSGKAPTPVGAPWQTKLDAGNPLVGRIWDTKAGAFVEESALLEQARQADFVLLGEKHDNPDHHRLQARVLSGLAARKPTVVMEMIDREQQASLDAFLGAHPGDAAALGGVLSWEKRGWPAWPMYQPIAEVTLRSGMRLQGGNITSSEARTVVKEGLDSLGAERVESWGLRAPMEEAARAALEEELNASHCGHLPAKLLPGMADAQRARDASMADQLLASAPAVLISGTGHARQDRGAPAYLRARRPGVRVVSVAFREVQSAQQDPGAKGENPFDFLWFTPRLDDEDPCARMGKR